tara:strand:- start:182 stop:574 length:393 start_codon:yes stop_codon:yes gene_type:complete
MSSSPYLVAIALIEQESKRFMPLGGKSLNEPRSGSEEPQPIKKAEILALELLTRVMQKSNENAIKLAAGEESILIIEIPFEEMQNKLPILKKGWINKGSKEEFLRELNKICINVWKLNFVRYQGIIFSKL